MATVFCYSRVSTLDQDTRMQQDALKSAYPEAVHRSEKASGTTTKGRDMLLMILDMVGTGDKLVVWKLDRLARNMHDLTTIVAALDAKGAALEILDQKIDTATASGKAFLQMLGVFAEFETNLRKERQLAGIAAAKKEGKHLGRAAKLTEQQRNEVRCKHKNGFTPSQLARDYDVSRATVYNVLKG